MTVVIENATVEMMLRDPRFAAALPCLRYVQSTSTGPCQTCKKKRRTQVVIDYPKAKKCIGALAGAGLANLKQLLGADRIRVSYNAKGRRIAKTL